MHNARRYRTPRLAVWGACSERGLECQSLSTRAKTLAAAEAWMWHVFSRQAAVPVTGSRSMKVTGVGVLSCRVVRSRSAVTRLTNKDD